MAPSSDPSELSDTFFQTADQELAQPPTYSLGDGLTALKREDYQTAIAHLEAVCQSALDEGTLLKAQMGLVMAYDRTGELKLAIALCKPLCDHSSEQVKSWAKQTLVAIEQRAQDSPSTWETTLPADNTPTEFQPETPDGGDRSTQAETPIHATGFVPLNPGATPLQPPRTPQPSPSNLKPSASGTQGLADSTGFVPLNSTAEPSTARPLARIPMPSEGASAATPPSPSPPQRESPAPSVSDVPIPRDDRPEPDLPPGFENPESLPDALAEDTPAEPYQAAWRNAERATRWTPLNRIRTTEFWIVLGGTAIAILLWLEWLLTLTVDSMNHLLFWSDRWLKWHDRLSIYDRTPQWLLLVILVVVLVTSPWLLTGLLRWLHGYKPMSIAELERRSPETARVIKRFCTQRRCQPPQLGLLPTMAPVAMLYGFMPWNAYLTISQGLLERLNEDEVAAIVAGELSHMERWDFVVLSWQTLLLQFPYTLYWQCTAWGDRTRNALLRTPAALVGAISYGLFWLMRLPGLWLARLRQYHSDRAAVNLTGNPNGLSRALLKISVGMVKEIYRQRETPYLVEGFELLIPVGARSAITPGSLHAHTPLEPILAWDCQHPFRRWLVINNAQALLGDRLLYLHRYARHWHLNTELDDLGRATPSPKRKRSDLWLQGAPFFGIPVGMAVALLLWLFGAIASRLGWDAVEWFWGDRSLLVGCMAIGLSVGIFMRINRFFPNIRTHNVRANADLASLLSNPNALPIDSVPVQLQGRLLGHSGLSNALEQDLMLKTDTGSIKVHFFSPLGVFGNLFPQAVRPHDLINVPVSLTGWFRRGATPWIDVDLIRTQRGQVLRSGHPIWSTAIATAATIYGLSILLRGV